MGNSDTKMADNFLFLETEINAEVQNLRDILTLLGKSWEDPGAQLIEKELRQHVSVLEEKAAMLRKGAASEEEAPR